MKPEPTPSAGTPPNGSVDAPPVVILTTAGLSFDATSMTAEDSLMVTGCVPLVAVALPTDDVGTGRSKAPERSRTRTVPPEATTADRSEAATTVPRPGPERRTLVAATGTGSGATGAEVQAGWLQPGVALRAGSPGAGSYQRSEAGRSEGEAQAQRASGRGSGVGA